MHLSYHGTTMSNAAVTINDVVLNENRAVSDVGFGGGAFVTIGDLDSTATGIDISLKNVGALGRCVCVERLEPWPMRARFLLV